MTLESIIRYPWTVTTAISCPHCDSSMALGLVSDPQVLEIRCDNCLGSFRLYAEAIVDIRVGTGVWNSTFMQPGCLNPFERS